jgi:hypothetical protein
MTVDQDSEYRARVVDALAKKGISTKCPMCSSSEFKIHRNFTSPRLVHDVNEASLVIGEHRAIPCAVISCRNCGFLAQFRLKALGLMEFFSSEEENAWRILQREEKSTFDQ